METTKYALGVAVPAALAEQGFSARWFDRSPRRQDQGGEEMGIFTSLLQLLDRDGVEAGYLAVSFTTPQAVEFMSDNFWLFVRHWHGWCVRSSDGQVSWADAHRYARQTPASLAGRGLRFAQLRDSDVPDEHTQKSDLAALELKLRREGLEPGAKMGYHLTPYVSYSRIHDSWRGQGLGASLYLLSAAQLARSGRILAASTLRSGEALRLWERLVADPSVPTVTVNRHGTDVPAIDLR